MRVSCTYGFNHECVGQTHTNKSGQVPISSCLQGFPNDPVQTPDIGCSTGHLNSHPII